MLGFRFFICLDTYNTNQFHFILKSWLPTPCYCTGRLCQTHVVRPSVRPRACPPSIYSETFSNLNWNKGGILKIGVFFIWSHKTLCLLSKTVTLQLRANYLPIYKRKS